jgi:hypothetical protein
VTYGRRPGPYSSKMKQTPRDLTIFSPGDLAAATPPDAFREDRVLYDLARLANTPGLFQKYVERARIRFAKAAEKAALEHWISFYQTGGRLIEARLEMERRKSEYLQLAAEHEVKNKEKEATIARHEADAAEHNLRRDIAEYKRRDLDRFVEGGRPVSPPPPDTQPRLTAQQQRRLRRMEIEDQLRELDHLEAEAIKNARGEEDRLRIENMYGDKRDELREQLAKNLV